MRQRGCRGIRRSAPPAFLFMTSCYCINTFGAVADGVHINTAAIQGAIDAAHTAGGGRVEVAAGVYVTGSLELKSHVELHLCHGAVLKGSPCIGDYPALGVGLPAHRFQTQAGRHDHLGRSTPEDTVRRNLDSVGTPGRHAGPGARRARRNGRDTIPSAIM